MRDFKDIERDRNKAEKEKMKKEISDDILDVTEDTFNKLEDFFKRKKIEQEIRQNRRSIYLRIAETGLWLMFLLGLLLLLLNFVLGNVWLIIRLIKSLFFGV